MENTLLNTTNNRYDARTVRVKLGRNSIYVHISYDETEIVGIRISSPGKFQDTEIGNALDLLGEVITEEVKRVQEGNP